MKIRHFLGHLDPIYGGPTYSVPIQCINCQKEGAEMSFVTFNDSTPWEGIMKEEGVNVIEVPSPKNSYEGKFAVPYKNYLNSCTDLPDILHFHGIWMPANKVVGDFGRKNGIPYVINPRGDLETGRLNYNKFKKLKKLLAWYLYGKKLADGASCLLVTSEQERDGVRYLGCKAPIAIIPNGIELDAFPKEVVHNHGEKKVLLFLSRVNPIKGIEILIEAWSKLSEQLRSEGELHIAGNSDPKDYIHTLEHKVESMNLQDSIFFVGPINGEAKMRKYQDVNLFVLPTLNENFGNVVAEAMMCECPVITTTNAPWRCLTDYKCGWWIDLSVENLVKSMTEAMSLTDDERHELGKKSRQCITELFAAPSVAKKTMAVYKWVLGEGPKPDFVETVE